MKTSEKGIKFLINEEGVVLRPYLDSVGVPTIGVGCTYYENGQKVKMSDPPITRERAESLFRNLLKRYEDQVNKSITREINQNQFDALVSLCFNIGTNGFAGSTVAKRVNSNPCDKTIADAFQMWRNAGGKPILLARRKRESALYFS